MVKILGACPWRGDPGYQPALDSFLAQRIDGTLDHLLLYGFPYGADGERNLARAWTQAQGAALSGGYDALYTHCDDVSAPRGAVQQLWEMEQPIAYGLICRRHGDYHWTMVVSENVRHEPVTWDTLDKHPELARRRWGGAISVKGKGLSCCLIRREVLEEVEIGPRDGHPADHWLATEANKRHWLQKAHLGVVCGHIRADRRWAVWPDIEAWSLYRTERI